MYRKFSFALLVLKTAFFTIKAVMISRREFWKFYELIWLSIKFGQKYGYFQYHPVSGRMSG
jgi:hypothetical protein